MCLVYLLHFFLKDNITSWSKWFYLHAPGRHAKMAEVSGMGQRMGGRHQNCRNRVVSGSSVRAYGHFEWIKQQANVASTIGSYWLWIWLVFRDLQGYIIFLKNYRIVNNYLLFFMYFHSSYFMYSSTLIRQANSVN